MLKVNDNANVLRYVELTKLNDKEFLLYISTNEKNMDYNCGGGIGEDGIHFESVMLWKGDKYSEVSFPIENRIKEKLVLLDYILTAKDEIHILYRYTGLNDGEILDKWEK